MNSTGSSSSPVSPVAATYCAVTFPSHTTSSEIIVLTPAPDRGSHQCCTSPSGNWREAAFRSWRRHRLGSCSSIAAVSCSWSRNPNAPDAW